MRIATILVTFYLTILTTMGAASALNGEVFVAAGTSGTNAIPSSRTTNVTISATSKVTDGASAVAFSLNSSNALSTSGAQLFKVSNGGVPSLTLDSGAILYITDSLETNAFASTGVQIMGLTNSQNVQATAIANGVIFAQQMYQVNNNTNVDQTLAFYNFTNPDPDLLLDPSRNLGLTPYIFNARIPIVSGNIGEFRNDILLKSWFTFGGITASTNGFASGATDSAVTIAATGWTNTFGKNAVVYLTGTNTTYTVFNNAGTAIYTNLTTTGVLNTSVLLQPSGKVIVSGTAVFGRATPF